MTLQDLIDELSALRPPSARLAPVVVRSHDDCDTLQVIGVSYECGQVIIEVQAYD